MKYRGGESMVGRALAFVNQRAWRHWTGSRRTVPKTLIVITDGDSKDEFQSMAATMRDKGVNIISIGIDRARQDLLMDWVHKSTYVLLHVIQLHISLLT